MISQCIHTLIIIKGILIHSFIRYYDEMWHRSFGSKVHKNHLSLKFCPQGFRGAAHLRPRGVAQRFQGRQFFYCFPQCFYFIPYNNNLENSKLKNLKSHHIHFHVCTNSTNNGSLYCVSTREYYGCGMFKELRAGGWAVVCKQNGRLGIHYGNLP